MSELDVIYALFCFRRFTNSLQMSSPKKCVIIPGNGSGDVANANWYGWVNRTLNDSGIDSTLRNMPDPVVARRSIWLPFMKDDLGVDEAGFH